MREQQTAPGLRILAIDPATRTGWATNSRSGIESGVREFDLRRGESPGMRFLHFRHWLEVLAEATGAEVLVFEQAHHRGGAATELGVGFATRVMEVAAARGIEYRSCHTATLKKYATGAGNADKERMIEAALARFPQRRNGGRGGGLTNDEADALLLLSWGMDGFPEAARKRR